MRACAAYFAQGAAADSAMILQFERFRGDLSPLHGGSGPRRKYRAPLASAADLAFGGGA